MVQGFFYNSVDGDRKYNGSSVNESKRPFYKDGVFAGHLEVTADGGRRGKDRVCLDKFPYDT